MGLIGKLRNRLDPLTAWERTKARAATIADEATAGTPLKVALPVARRKSNEYVAALDSAMDTRGYKFAGWTSPSQVVFRYAAEEMEAERALREKTVFSGTGYIYPDVSSYRPLAEAVDSTWISITRDAVVFGSPGEAEIPLTLVEGYLTWTSQSIEWNGLVIRASINDLPGPFGIKFSGGISGGTKWLYAIERGRARSRAVG